MTSRPPAELLTSLGIHSGLVRALDTGTSVFLIDAPSGPWVLKRTFLLDLPTIHWQHALLRELAAARLPVPRPVSHLAGNSYVTVDGEHWVALSYLQGRPLRASGVVAHEAVGDLIASFHEVTSTLAMSDNPSFEPLATTLSRLNDDWSISRFGMRRAGQLRACRDQTLAELESHVAGKPALVVHGDLHVGNILVSLGQARITGVIDFDLAHKADPLVDLAFSIWWWCRPAVQEGVWDAVTGTLIGYCRRRALAVDASTRLVTLLKARGLMLLVRLRDYDQACDEIHETLRFVIEREKELTSFVRDALAGAIS